VCRNYSFVVLRLTYGSDERCLRCCYYCKHKIVPTRLFVLYCRSHPKDDKSRHFDPHFEEVRGGVEPWWMARWKARVEFLLSVIELVFLSLTVEALQGKMCENSLPSGVGRSLGAKISGGRGGLGRNYGIKTVEDCFLFVSSTLVAICNVNS